MHVVLLAGGLGGARLAPALAREIGPGSLDVIANVGDDLEWMGLKVCPDLDSIAYALAGLWDGVRGWGRRGETFAVRDGLRGLGAAVWFGIGDRDLALHLERARMLGEGRSLTEVTADLARRLGVRGAGLLPASDRPSPTRLRLADGRRLDFQEWYVREHAQPVVAETVPAGGAAAEAALGALARADAVVLAPSNPLTSIGPILALDGMEAAMRRVPRRLAVSPVVCARPSASASIEHHARARRRVLEAAGLADRPASIAVRYRNLVDAFVLDESDAGEVEAIARLGLRAVTADILDESRLAGALGALIGRT
ncbi:MAG: YvcK family protein [Deltaproteobacteria bacterium]|nr:YvcK family protein [Deltaproteobacteria bacterium]